MVEKIQLENGLNVILKESHKSPVVSIQMWVKTGSADEQKGEEGLSHFIEHLVFKGTDKYKVGEIAQKVEGAGGRLNAYTSFDETVFYVTLSSAYTNFGLDVIKEMMLHPKFDQGEIDNEREVVIEEIKMGRDNPHRKASRLLFSKMYPEHGYGLPVIGFEENIRTVSRETIKDYFQRRYTPNNMSLVVVGDFNSKEVKQKIEEEFSSAQGNFYQAIQRHGDEKTTEGIHVQEEDFNESLLYISWKTPNVRSEDTAKIDLLSLLLGGGENSRLMQATRVKKPLANYTSASSFTPKNKGFFTISSSFSYSKMNEVLDAIHNELEAVFQKGFTQEEMERIKVAYQSSEFYSMETVDGLSRNIGTFENLFSDPNYHSVFLEEFMKVNHQDLMSVMEKYLTPEQMVITFMKPQKEGSIKESEKLFEQFKKGYAQIFSQRKNQSEKQYSGEVEFPRVIANERSTDPVVYTTSQGSRLLFRPSFETPVMSLKLGTLGGIRKEQQGKEGSTELFSRLWGTETQTLNEQDLSQKMELLASSISAFSGRNSFGLSLKTLTAFSEQSFDLFSDILLNPKFSDDLLKREIYFMNEKRKKREDSPTQLVLLSVMENFFKDHPYAKDMLGSENSLAGMKASDFSSIHQNFIGSGNLVVSCVGNFDPELWKDKIEQLIDERPKIENPNIDLEKPFQYISEEKEVHIPLEKEQNHLALVYPGVHFTDKDQFPLQLIQSILSGQGGRLFMELRDKESLAYSVSPIRFDGYDVGYFGGYIGCSPEKTEKAFKMLEEEFLKLANEKVKREELDQAKKNVLGLNDIELQKNGSIATYFLFDELYQQGLNSFEKYREKINQVSEDDILRVAGKIFSQPKLKVKVGT